MANSPSALINMDQFKIVIATEFSRSPAGRFAVDGPHSGEIFREQFLYPRLAGGSTVEVDLDGTLGCGSSFLEEAFGGLIREKKMSLEDLTRRLRIKSNRKFYEARIWQYMNDAALKAKG